MAKNILITGGAGFIGSHLVDKLSEGRYQCTILDNLSGNEGIIPEYLNKDARFIQGDVRDYKLLKKIIPEHDAIIHLAALVGIAQSNYKIKEFIDNNENGTATLLQALIDSKQHKKLENFILASSNTTYGEGLYHCQEHGVFHPDIRSSEDIKKYGLEIICSKCKSPARPIPTPEDNRQPCNSIYSFTKRNQEEMCMSIGKLYEFPVTVLRLFNVFGPRQSLSNPYTGVSAIFTSKIKNNLAPIIYEDGKQSRDFVSVYDVVDAIFLTLTNKLGGHNIFNVGTGRAQPIKDVARIIARAYGKKIKPNITNKFRKGDIRHCIADRSKILDQLGWSPKTSFEEGIKEIIEWSGEQKAIDKTDIATKELRERGLI